MSQIRCPHCQQVFTIDKSEYQELLDQVRNETLKEEINERAKQIEVSLKQQQEVDANKKEVEHQKELKDLERRLLEAEAKIKEADANKEAAVSKAKEASALEISKLKEQQSLASKNLEANIAELKSQLKEADDKKRIAVLEKQQEEEKKRNEVESQLKDAQNKIESFEQAKKSELALVEAKQKNELDSLRGELENQKSQAELEKRKLEESHQLILKMKDEEIAKYKEFKLGLSTKMIGESLEQYCYNEFNKVRTVAFPNVYFEKDNDSSSGTKGDFIYRETDEGGIEILSIMFEMKNEADDSSHKHRNEDFFSKLDKDRAEKKCEYAVLVSMLEPENDYYNAGIVDVSYRYPKMYVIRPQCFIPMITLLRNAAMRSLEDRRALDIVRKEQIDVTHFEEKLEDFKGKIGRNFELASKKYDLAIEDLDKAIKALQKMRDELVSSKDHLRIATNQTQDITVRRLTTGNETMKKLFKEAKEKRENTFDSTTEEDE